MFRLVTKLLNENTYQELISEQEKIETGLMSKAKNLSFSSLSSVEGLEFVKKLKNQNSQAILNYLYEDVVKPYFAKLKSTEVDSRNKVTANGHTLLHWAIYLNQAIEVIEPQITAENIKLADFKGFQPLHFAAYFGHEEAVKKILAAGAKDQSSCESPLVSALRKGHLAIAETLLEITDLRREISYTSSALYFVLKLSDINLQIKIINKYISSSVNSQILRLFFRSALFDSIDQANLEVVKLLMSRVNDFNLTFDSITTFERNCLISDNANTPIIRPYQFKTVINESYLHKAIRLGKKDIVALFIGKKPSFDVICEETQSVICRINGRTYNQRIVIQKTALGMAAQSNDCSTVKLLLENGAHPFDHLTKVISNAHHVPLYFSRSAEMDTLLLAARQGQYKDKQLTVKIYQLLRDWIHVQRIIQNQQLFSLKYFAYIERITNNNNEEHTEFLSNSILKYIQELIAAAVRSSQEIVDPGVGSMLIQFAVFINDANLFLELIRKILNESIALLNQKVICTNKAFLSIFQDGMLHYCVSQNLLEMADLVISNFPNLLDATNSTGLTPLQAAMNRSQFEMVQKLLNAGASLNENPYQYTLLHQAISFGNLDLIQLLIGKGANINAQDEQGNTPLHLALIELKQHANFLEIIDLLLAQNPDVTIKNTSGKMAKQLTTDDSIRRKIIELEPAQEASEKNNTKKHSVHLNLFPSKPKKEFSTYMNMRELRK